MVTDNSGPYAQIPVNQEQKSKIPQESTNLLKHPFITIKNIKFPFFSSTLRSQYRAASRFKLYSTRTTPMGAVCQSCLLLLASKKELPHPTVKQDNPLQTSRRLAINLVPPQEQQGESLGPRGSNLEIQSNPSAMKEAKLFGKTKSTTLFSSIERHHSSICQFTLDQDSIILHPSHAAPHEQAPPDQFYTLISKVAFVRKTLDCIKVTTPEGQSVIHCPPQLLFTTLTVSEGRPAESIEEVAPNKIIQVTDSPIRANLRLKCRTCKRKMKITCSKGVIALGTIQCPNCQAKDWALMEIDCNAPVWGDGTKLDPHEALSPAPSILRIMGCVVCLKFINCSPMDCGCLLCSDCLLANPQLSLELSCRLCRGGSLL